MSRIRDQQPGDEAAVHAVIVEAFGRETEAELVARLHRNGKTVLALVAEEEGRVLGCVVFSRIAVESRSGEVAALALAPLAVLPAFQRLGIGSALVSAGLARCREVGHSRVVVLGEPAYYVRFGFSPAADFRIGVVGKAPSQAFMVLALEPGAFDGCTGVVRYPAEFEYL